MKTLAPMSGGTVVSEVAPALFESFTHDDTQARRILQCAQGAFQKWPEGFAGFSAAIRCREGGAAVDGEVSVFIGGRVELRLPHDGALAAWVGRALGAIAWARTPRFFKDGEGRFPITFEPDPHPLGRGVRVHLGGAGWRTYRFDPKGRIRQQENAEPATRAAMRYDELMRACPGRVLPTRIQILTWDIAAQTVVETTDIEDAYQRCQHVWLPVRRRATVVHGQDRRELGFELSGHVLL
jgi:hypothetical protein